MSYPDDQLDPYGNPTATPSGASAVLPPWLADLARGAPPPQAPDPSGPPPDMGLAPFSEDQAAPGIPPGMPPQGPLPAMAPVAPIAPPPVEVPHTVQPGTGAPPPTTAVPPPPAPNAAKAPDEFAKATAESQAGLGLEQKGQTDLATAEATEAGAKAADYEHRNEALYGKIDPKTGQQTGGLIAERQAAQAKNEADLAAKTTAITAAVDTEAKYKIDDNRRWNNLSTGRKVLTAIGLILSGVGSAMMGKGGENPALNLLMGSIKDDVEAQVRERGALRDRIGIARNSLDDYHKLTDRKESAMNLKIAEEYKRTADQIEQESSKYADQKVKAQGLMAAGQLRERAGALMAGAAHEAWQRDYQKTQQAEEMRSHRASEGLQRASLAQNENHFQASMAQAKSFHDDDINEKALALTKAGKAAEAAALVKQNEELKNDGFMAPVGVTKAEDGTLTPKYDYLKQQDGTPYIAPKETQKELRTRYAGTIQAIDALDNLRKLREENGGNVNKWSADAKAKAVEYERALVGAHQAAGIAGFRGNVMEVMDKMTTGNTDPTSSLVSVLPQLDRARANLETDLHGSMVAHNYTGKPIHFPDPIKAPKAADTIEEKDLGTLRNDLPGGMEDLMPNLSDPESIRLHTEANKANIVPSHKQVLDTYAAQLANPATEAAAEKFLVGVLDGPEKGPGSVNPATRKYIKGILGRRLLTEMGGAPKKKDPYEVPNPGDGIKDAGP